MVIRLGIQQYTVARWSPLLYCVCSSLLDMTHHQGQFQQGQTLGISGGIEITQTYKCTWGTCFRANMKLVDYSVGVNKAEGYWQGSNLQFTRYVGTENTPESWSGQCLENAITNNCYFPNSPNKKYLFTITY